MRRFPRPGPSSKAKSAGQVLRTQASSQVWSSTITSPPLRIPTASGELDLGPHSMH